jgi:hypothetical protein
MMISGAEHKVELNAEVARRRLSILISSANTSPGGITSLFRRPMLRTNEDRRASIPSTGIAGRLQSAGAPSGLADRIRDQ